MTENDELRENVQEQKQGNPDSESETRDKDVDEAVHKDEDDNGWPTCDMDGCQKPSTGEFVLRDGVENKKHLCDTCWDAFRWGQRAKRAMIDGAAYEEYGL